MVIELRDFSIPSEGELPITVTGRIVLRADGKVEFPASFPDESAYKIITAFLEFAAARTVGEDAEMCGGFLHDRVLSGDRAIPGADRTEVLTLRTEDIVEEPVDDEWSRWMAYLEKLGRDKGRPNILRMLRATGHEFSADEDQLVMTLTIVCPDLTEEETRQIAAAVSIEWRCYINGRPVWEILP